MTAVEINQALQQAVASCAATARQYEETVFLRQAHERWSRAEHLIHLTKVASSVCKALQMPASMLQSTFGAVQHTTRPYDEIVEHYDTALKGDFVRALPFCTFQTDTDTQDSVLLGFVQQHEILGQLLLQRTEEELDACQIPHPAMGNLTLREFYYFLIYHIGHHQRGIEQVAF